MSGANNYGGTTGGSGGGNDDSGLNDSSGSGISDHPRNGSHISNIRKLKANFCGREKEGHFHSKNFLRALK